MDSYKTYNPKLVALCEPIKKGEKTYHLAFCYEDQYYYIITSNMTNGKINWLYKASTWQQANSFFEGLK